MEIPEAIQSLESQLTSTQRDLREAEYNHQQAVLEIERQQVFNFFILFSALLTLICVVTAEVNV